MSVRNDHCSPRTVLITGASSGIGAAFARVYAQKGYTLILHAPSWEENNITGLSEKLSQEYGTKSHKLHADLTDPQAPLQIFDEITALNIPVDTLVNCAGIIHYEPFHSKSWSEHERYLSIMLHASCHMIHLFIPAMIERGYGRIINVASITGLMPGLPSISIYGASKAFLIKFSESLAAEVALDGVHVTALCPGMTRTGLFAPAGLEKKVSHIPEFFWLDADRVAREGFQAVEKNIPVYINGFINRLVVSISNILPRKLIRHFAKKHARRIRAKAQRKL